MFEVIIRDLQGLSLSQEELVDFEARQKRRTSRELAEMVLIRCLTNTFTFLVLVGSGVAIFYAAQFSLQSVSPLSHSLSLHLSLCHSLQGSLVFLPSLPPSLHRLQTVG